MTTKNLPMRECSGQRFYYNGNMYNCSEFQPSMVFEGESVYEVIRLISGMPLFLEDHLQRLHHTLGIQKKKIKVAGSEIMQAVKKVIRENHITEGNIKVIFNFDHDRHGTSHFLVYRIEHHYPSTAQYDNGVSCILYQAERPQPTAKIIHHNLRLTLYNKLIETGMYEAILVNNRGCMTEGSRSNIFFIKNNKLFTAPDALVLSGISRSYVIKISDEKKIPLHMKAIPVDDLPDMDAVFLTGTSIKILPVSAIGNNHFAMDHPLMQQLMNEYDRMVISYIKEHQ